MRINDYMWKIKRRNPSCNNKIMFQTLADAQVALANYKKRVVLTNMEVYYCPKHDAYHLGHESRYPKGFFERLLQGRKGKKSNESQ